MRHDIFIALKGTYIFYWITLVFITMPLTFQLRRNWLYLLITTLLCILVFQFMSIRDSAGHGEFNALARGEVARYITNLAYYFPLELITVGVIVLVLTVYKKVLRLHSLAPTTYGLLLYQLIYLPAVLVGIGLACPITNTVRYLIMYANEYGWTYYYPNYCLTWRMYGKYLLPALLFSYSYLNANLLLDYVNWQRGLLTLRKSGRMALSSGPLEANDFHSEIQDSRSGKATSPYLAAETNDAPDEVDYLTVIEVFEPRGQSLLPLKQVYYFEVQNKTYRAHTIDKAYTIHLPFSQLVPQLNLHQFLRISRSVVVNIQYVDNYSHWEYDKFIIRLKDKSTEFVMQRTHLKALKALLARTS